jgi:hypothetical protein
MIVRSKRGAPDGSLATIDTPRVVASCSVEIVDGGAPVPVGSPGSAGVPDPPGGADVDDGPVAQATVNINGEMSARTRSMYLASLRDVQATATHDPFARPSTVEIVSDANGRKRLRLVEFALHQIPDASMCGARPPTR